MSTDRHIRCWLLAALASAIALSDLDARPRETREITIAALTAGSSTRARPFARHAAAYRARPLEAFTLAQPLRDSIVTLALRQLGMPYVHGGATPRRGFDCSGLVKYVVAQLHMSVPRTANLQARVGAPIDRSRLEPGDLIAFGRGSISHIGIYVGDGKFVHASSAARRVIISPLDRTPSRLIKPMRGARRLLATADPYGHSGG